MLLGNSPPGRIPQYIRIEEWYCVAAPFMG